MPLKLVEACWSIFLHTPPDWKTGATSMVVPSIPYDNYIACSELAEGPSFSMKENIQRCHVSNVLLLPRSSAGGSVVALALCRFVELLVARGKGLGNDGRSCFELRFFKWFLWAQGLLLGFPMVIVFLGGCHAFLVISLHPDYRSFNLKGFYFFNEFVFWGILSKSKPFNMF